jgi:hypothetical protein
MIHLWFCTKANIQWAYIDNFLRNIIKNTKQPICTVQKCRALMTNAMDAPYNLRSRNVLEEYRKLNLLQKGGPWLYSLIEVVVWAQEQTFLTNPEQTAQRV